MQGPPVARRRRRRARRATGGWRPFGFGPPAALAGAGDPAHIRRHRRRAGAVRQRSPAARWRRSLPRRRRGLWQGMELRLSQGCRLRRFLLRAVPKPGAPLPRAGEHGQHAAPPEGVRAGAARTGGGVAGTGVRPLVAQLLPLLRGLVRETRRRPHAELGVQPRDPGELRPPQDALRRGARHGHGGRRLREGARSRRSAADLEHGGDRGAGRAGLRAGALGFAGGQSRQGGAVAARIDNPRRRGPGSAVRLAGQHCRRPANPRARRHRARRLFGGLAALRRAAGAARAGFVDRCGPRVCRLRHCGCRLAAAGPQVLRAAHHGEADLDGRP
mmetsp:Transcript_113152/g.325330  ORF Transcript_113152/g.325330 Transcript_113152/m.325330 type:complete len:330 (+) Transcript_113152:212-1201(+)